MFKLKDRNTPDGTILVMGIQYNDSPKTFTYALLKVDGLWHVTGAPGRVPYAAGWGAVERWLAKDGRNLVWVKVVSQTMDVGSSYPIDPQRGPE